MPGNRNTELRLRSLIVYAGLCVLLNTGLASAKPWRTFWNGERKKKTNPLDIGLMRHAPVNPADFVWELTNIFAGHNETTKEAIPAFQRKSHSRSLVFSKMLDTGLAVSIEKIMRYGKELFYGVKLEGSPDTSIYWVAGGNMLKKSVKK